MGLNILPKAGINFKTNSGAGNFKRKLDKLTYHQGGEFGMLRNNREAIAKAIVKREGVIKIKGGLDRLQRKSALLEIMKNDKSLTKMDKYKVKELLEYYARDKKSPEPVSKAAINIERDDSEALSTHPNFSHVSNPNYFREVTPPTTSHLGGGAGPVPPRVSPYSPRAESRIQQGRVAQAKITYEKLSRLPSSDSGMKKIQQESFRKLSDLTK